MLTPMLAEMTGNVHVGLAALGAAIGVGFIGMKASEAVGRNPKCGEFFAALAGGFDLLRRYPHQLSGGQKARFRIVVKSGCGRRGDDRDRAHSHPRSFRAHAARLWRRRARTCTCELSDSVENRFTGGAGGICRLVFD